MRHLYAAFTLMGALLVGPAYAMPGNAIKGPLFNEEVTFTVGVNAGYVTGAINAYIIFAPKTGCTFPEIPNVQVLKIVDKWMAANPEYLHYDMALLSVWALDDTFCGVAEEEPGVEADVSM